jgi:adenine-specific DNA-methyltransferase
VAEPASRELFLLPVTSPATVPDAPSDARSAGTLRFARAFTRAAVRAYWRALCLRAGVTVGIPRSPRVDVLPRGEDRRCARRLGTGVASLATDEAAFALSTAYAELLPARMRVRRGVYFTPPPVAARLLDMAAAAGCDWAVARVIDPSCGAGAFLVPVAERMRRTALAAGADAEAVLAQVEHRLAGIELDPFAAWMARVFVRAVTLAECAAAGRPSRPRIRVADALRCLAAGDVGAEWDLVVGNPPFGRRRLPSELRHEYRESLFGHANLYGLFTHLGVRLTRPGGLLAHVTPTSFLGGQYFTRLRELLLRDAPPTAVDFVRDRAGVFAGVLQETALVVFARSRPSVAVRVGEFVPRRRAGDVLHVGSYPAPAAGSGPWILPRAAGQTDLVAALHGMRHRLADYGYEVSTGPLVWNRHRPQLRWKRERGAFPVVWAAAVLPAGTFDFRAAEARRPLFIQVRADQPHLLQRRACIVLQRTTAKEQARRLVAAVMPEEFVAAAGGVVVENHLNVVRATTPTPVVEPEILVRFLNSAALDLVFRCISGSVAVSSYELESLPLPAPEVAVAIARAAAADAAPLVVDALLAQAYALGPVRRGLECSPGPPPPRWTLT